VDTFSYLGSLPQSKNSPILKIFKALKLVRARRLIVFIKKLNFPLRVKTFIKFLTIAFYLFLWIHIAACLWFSIVNHSGEIPSGFEEIPNPDDAIVKLIYNP
jgi:hypothetical protein